MRVSLQERILHITELNLIATRQLMIAIRRLAWFTFLFNDLHRGKSFALRLFTFGVADRKRDFNSKILIKVVNNNNSKYVNNKSKVCK